MEYDHESEVHHFVCDWHGILAKKNCACYFCDILREKQRAVADALLNTDDRALCSALYVYNDLHCKVKPEYDKKDRMKRLIKLIVLAWKLQNDKTWDNDVKQMESLGLDVKNMYGVYLDIYRKYQGDFRRVVMVLAGIFASYK